MQSPFPSPLQKRDEGSAPSLSRSYVVFGIRAVLLATPTPVCDLMKLRFLISISCPSGHRTGPPVLLRMASPTCHPCHPGSLSVGSGSYCQDRHTSLPLTSRGSATPLLITRLRLGSLSLQPAGLRGSPNEPLSGNLVLQVTPCTSLTLHG